eukprot:Opistho-1_new@856
MSPPPRSQLRELECGQVGVEIERVRVRERRAVVHGLSADNLLHGDLDLLAVDRVRDRGRREDDGGHVTRRQLLANGGGDALDNVVVELVAGCHHEEQNHALVGAHLLCHAQAVGDLGEGLHDVVNLGAAKADASGVQRAVAAPKHPDAASRRCNLHKVAVRPHSVVLAEVRAAVLGAVGVVPERDGHRGEGHRAHKLTALVKHGVAAFVPALHLHAEVARLDLTPDDGKGGIRTREARDDVSAARNRAEEDVLLDARVHVVKALGLEGRARRENRTHSVQLVRLNRSDVLVLERRKPLCAGAKHSDANLVGEVPQRDRCGDERRAVVENNGAAGRKATDEPVPHHPSRRGVIEEHVVAGEVGVQLVLLHVLNKCAACAVDHALGHARGARREHNVERVVEWQLLKLEHGVRLGERQERLVQLGLRNHGEVKGRRLDKGENDDALQVAKALDDLEQLAHVVVHLAVVVHGVHRENHLGVDLAEALKHARDAKVGRSGAPDGTNARRRQHELNSLHAVGDVADDAVSRRDARLPHGRRSPRHARVQLTVRHLERLARLTRPDEGDAVVVVAEEVLGKVEARAAEPLGHFVHALCPPCTLR